MLEISPSAADVIRQLVDDAGPIEGVRVGLGPSQSTNGSAPLVRVVIAPAEGPLDQDETIVDDGVAVFVDPTLAPLLEDKLLDIVPAGSEEVQFTLIDRS